MPSLSPREDGSSLSQGRLLSLQHLQNAPRPDATPLPAEVADVLWRGDALGRASTAVWPSGFDALDAELPGGGWPAQQLTEILQTQPSLAEWRLVGPALRRVVHTGAPVVLIGPPKRPHLPGLLHLGLQERHLVWIQAQAPSERLWCAEQLIKSNAAGAVMAWMPQAAPEQLRRLQVLAQTFEGPVFLFRPREARHDPSPAPLRVDVSVGLDWQLEVRVIKRKGPAMETPLRLASIPGGLDLVLTPRVMQPSRLVPVVVAATPAAAASSEAAALAAPAEPASSTETTEPTATTATPAADSLTR